MLIDNQRGVVTSMGAGAASGESVRKDELDTSLGSKADKTGATFTGPAIVADYQGGGIAAGGTATPDVTPGSGKQCFSYVVNGNCTLGALAGTGAMANDTAMAGSVYLTFTGAYTVTIASSYKLPSGVSNSITGANGEVWRLDFQHRKTAGRCSASVVKEAT